ncbi:acyl-coA thioesterase II [Vairimorpha necatrix]|uniref:Acyl-coA thioesterase II n=1 Tax=Vairimorpha necatrix TaxID=6039 RepID=A0AAX4JGI2_9MICR
MDFLNIRETKENIYEGTKFWSPYPGYPIFGGQLAAQSLCACLHTVHEDSFPNIVHSLFVNPGDPSLPVEYTVECLKDGKTIQMRNVVGRQNNIIIIQTLICCTLPDKNIKKLNKIFFLRDTSYISINDYIIKNLKNSENPQYDLLVENLGILNKSFDIQIGDFIDNKRQICIEIKKKEILKHEFYLFMTLVSDLLLVESALLSLNMNIFSKELYKISSVDHNLYFVGSEIPKRGKIFYILECTNIKESKAIITGKMCTEEGIMICETTQQALIRFK